MVISKYYYINVDVNEPISQLRWGISICKKLNPNSESPITIYCKTRGCLDKGGALDYYFYPHITQIKKEFHVDSLIGKFQFNFSNSFVNKNISPIGLLIDINNTLINHIERNPQEVSIVIVNYYQSYEETNQSTQQLLSKHPLEIIVPENSNDYKHTFDSVELALVLQEKLHPR